MLEAVPVGFDVIVTVAISVIAENLLCKTPSANFLGVNISFDCSTSLSSRVDCWIHVS